MVCEASTQRTRNCKLGLRLQGCGDRQRCRVPHDVPAASSGLVIGQVWSSWDATLLESPPPQGYLWHRDDTFSHGLCCPPRAHPGQWERERWTFWNLSSHGPFLWVLKNPQGYPPKLHNTGIRVRYGYGYGNGYGWLGTGNTVVTFCAQNSIYESLFKA
eukprot:1156539-Pelagomonas_calceolata.AAC.2